MQSIFFPSIVDQKPIILLPSFVMWLNHTFAVAVIISKCRVDCINFHIETLSMHKGNKRPINDKEFNHSFLNSF